MLAFVLLVVLVFFGILLAFVDAPGTEFIGSIALLFALYISATWDISRLTVFSGWLIGGGGYVGLIWKIRQARRSVAKFFESET